MPDPILRAAPDPAERDTMVTPTIDALFQARTDFAKRLNDVYAELAWLRSNAALIALPVHAEAFRSRMDRSGMLVAEASAQVIHAALEGTA